MGKKKVLVLDRNYCVKYMKSNIFDVIVVCLSEDSKRKHIGEGLNVIACFEEEYDSLEEAKIPANYLIHSWDSDRFLKRYDYKKRKEILGKEISFWSNIFDTYYPDCIVNEVVTIELMEVMFIEAQKRNIPYFRWGLWPLHRLEIWLKDSPFNSRMSKSYWESIEEESVDLEKAHEYIIQVRNTGSKPFYIQKKTSRTLNTLLKHSWNYTQIIFHYYIRRIKRNKFYYEDYFNLSKKNLYNKWSRFMHHEYDKLVMTDNTEYFFYPLHYEPEATIEYSGYHFNDQVMLIGRIAHCLKTNQMLIVKEHPQQLGTLMNRNYRELKKKYTNILFLPGTISSSLLFPKIKCLITLTGTAGFESWVCKKPVIVFGEIFYKDFPGIIQCDSFKELYDIIRNDKYQTANDEMIISYVAKMYHEATEMFPFIFSGFSKEEDCNIIAQQVEQLLMQS